MLILNTEKNGFKMISNQILMNNSEIEQNDLIKHGRIQIQIKNKYWKHNFSQSLKNSKFNQKNGKIILQKMIK